MGQNKRRSVRVHLKPGGGRGKGMMKSLLVLLIGGLLASLSGCDECDCERNQRCVEGKCLTECDSTKDCSGQHGVGWVCFTDGLCRFYVPSGDGNQIGGDSESDSGNNGGGGSRGVSTPEICDGLDNDFDGVVDNGCACLPGESTFCLTGLPGVCAAGTATCLPNGEGYGFCVPNAEPQPEICGDGLDNDCDGRVDNGCACEPGESTFCLTGLPGICSAGTAMCLQNGEGYGFCVPNAEPQPEICGDGLDNDCDGEADEGCPGNNVAVSDINCRICCPGDLYEATWFGVEGSSLNSGGCLDFNVSVQTLCERGAHPEFPDSGWLDFSCWDSINDVWGDWIQNPANGLGVISCVDQNGFNAPFVAQSGTVDYVGEAEVIILNSCF
jgi:hypothetical protein